MGENNETSDCKYSHWEVLITPSDIQEATCFCGETAISFKNDPMMHFMCHCTDCKVLFDGSSKMFVYTELDVELSGAFQTFSYKGGSGNLLNLTFCSSCGMNVCTKPDLLEGMVYVFSGMLRAFYEFKPNVELFTDHRFPWEKQPDTAIQSYAHNGTVERIGELLENLDQRG